MSDSTTISVLWAVCFSMSCIIGLLVGMCMVITKIAYHMIETTNGMEVTK